MSDIQAMIDNLSKQWREERSQSQMTLGKFISELENLPQEKLITNLTSPHSYRGYYEDLAFEQEGGTRTVGSLLEVLQNECLNKTFTGYKGGDFFMNENTPLWVAYYGDCGPKFNGIYNHEEIVTLDLVEDN